MSILFPKVKKPREWDYRPIYYDPEKEERKEKLRELQMQRGESDSSVKGHTLHRGSFREAADRNKSDRLRNKKHSSLLFWVIVLALLVFVFYFLI